MPSDRSSSQDPRHGSGAAPLPAFMVRRRAVDDLPGIVALMSRVYPPPHPPEALWSEGGLRTHIERFPEGQLAAADWDGRILGDSTGMRIAMEKVLAPHTWSEITGHGRLGTHDPRGDAFYGVDIAVDPAWRGQGVASAIYAMRFQVARELGCRAFVAGARIPGYHQVAERMPPQRYVEEVAAGARKDATLSVQLHLGFQVVALLPRYFRDFQCLDYGVLIVKNLERP